MWKGRRYSHPHALDHYFLGNIELLFSAELCSRRGARITTPKITAAPPRG
ncbi:hypothetical protein QFZ36_000549 [Pseudarthrobacter siccitolerans]|uniref:Uncharacterized protein n=1 Tax=Pseudarthrobacter siccitolerans TaxID=861266 RepID=A0ABU0PG92_9MICC|nr:hypothetical protein [Pseudarthrobacter siccitolerans]